jgi:hypothetical protein
MNDDQTKHDALAELLAAIMDDEHISVEIYQPTGDEASDGKHRRIQRAIDRAEHALGY